MKKILGLIIILVALALAALSVRPIPDQKDIRYGVSFSVFHSKELGLDWKPTFDAIIGDLGVRRFRFSAHWQITEPQDGQFHFEELDYQMKQAESHQAKVVLAVGRRLPGWPECHEPQWAWNLPNDQKRAKLDEYIKQVVNRYKNSPALEYWQVENEPFLTKYATYYCGNFLDKAGLQKEISLVKSLDPKHPVLVTDSGELSTWYNAHNLGDAFGTSVYLYVWTTAFGPIRYPIPPAFFRIKRNLIELMNGKKDEMLIELSAEPWLLQPIKDTPIDTQTTSMSLSRFNSILDFASKTSFDKQYLWGAEWWYYMKQHGHPEFWNRAKEIFSEEK